MTKMCHVDCLVNVLYGILQQYSAQFASARQWFKLLQLNLLKDQYSNSPTVKVWQSVVPITLETHNLPLGELPLVGNSALITLLKCLLIKLSPINTTLTA